MKTKRYYYLLITLLFIGGISFIFSCDKEKDINLPQTNRLTIETDSVKSVLYHTAIVYGSIGELKNITIQQYGHCWDTIEIPTLESNKTLFSNLTSNSTFNSHLTDLKPAKKYYVRSYAKTNSLTAYSEITSFTTKSLEPPTLTSDSIRSITSTTANIWGSIKLDGGTAITARGVCWGTTANSIITGQHAESNIQTNSFSTPITGLTRKTTYHARVYAINSSGTAYGNDITFTTLAELPILTTAEVTNITAFTAISGGNITNDGSADITERGVCWSLNQNPTITDSHSSNGTGSGIFISSITELQAGKSYYVRAYAKNSIGTVYGNQVSFTTPAVLPTVITTKITNFTATTATCEGNVLEDGGAAITERGVCLSTSPSPTIDDSKLTNGSGTGVFIINFTGLTTGSNYYIRAYAVNSIGVAYGEELSFTTILVAIDYDGNVYNTVKIGTQIWMKENLRVTHYRNGDAIANITNNSTWSSNLSGEYCWYENDIGNKNPYGAIYNFYAAVDTRNLCPLGWHIPSDSEWSTLNSYLGGSSVAGGKLKEAGTSHWLTPNSNSDNSSNFTAVPSGSRTNTGVFNSIYEASYMWSSTEYNSTWSYARYLLYNSVQFYRADFEKNLGFSVRCLKDN